jgi:hypothetical protein
MKFVLYFLLFLIAVLAVYILFSEEYIVRSPNGDFIALKKGDNYQVLRTSNLKTVFTTHPEFHTPNDVKAVIFSDDSSMFAAAYHYSDMYGYTWIGVWSTETGEFLYSRKKSFYTTDLSGVFDPE